MEQQRSGASTRWRMLLAPWRSAAESLGQILRAPTHCDAHARGGLVWLLWDVPQDDSDGGGSGFDGDEEALQQQLELMELLDLLARVDRAVFEEFVLVVCGETEGAQLLHHTRSDEDDAVVNFRFAYQIEIKSHAVLSSSLVMQRLLMGFSAVEMSTAFKEVRQALVQAIEEKTGEHFGRLEHPIPVRLDCAHRPQCDTSWLTALAQFAALQASMVRESEELGEDSKASVFRVKYVRISLVHAPEPATLILTSLARITRLGIEISYLRISTIYLSTVDPVTVTRALHELFAPSQNPAVRQGPVRGVRHLEMNLTLMEYWSFRRICSAVAHSQTLRTITLCRTRFTLRDLADSDANDDQLMLRAQWLGFTLFSAYATHSIETLRFSEDALMLEWARRIARVVVEPFPVIYLDFAFDNAKDHTFVDIPPQARMWLRRPGGGLASSSSIDTPCIRFSEGLNRIYVLGYDSEVLTEWLTVFLPGWGEAWVDATAIAGREIEPTPSLRDTKRIPRVVITCRCDSTASLILRMLECVGSKSVELDIDALGRRVAVGTLTTLVTRFPALTTLRLNNMTLESIRPIFDGYKTGISRLASLALRSVVLPEGELQELMTSKLANKFDPCWIYLRELSVYDVCERSPDGDKRSLHEECVRLHQLCPQLPGLQVVVDDSTFGGLLTEVERFSAMHGHATNVRKAPLAMICKMALLSVLRQSTSSASCAMASDVVATIFEFAASTFVRRCAIQIRTRTNVGDIGAD